MNYPLTNSLLAKKPKPKPAPKGPAVPLPGYPIRTGLDKPTIWGGNKFVLGRR